MDLEKGRAVPNTFLPPIESSALFEKTLKQRYQKKPACIGNASRFNEEKLLTQKHPCLITLGYGHVFYTFLHSDECAINQ